MNEVIAVINQKGGVGKSSTTLALIAGLRRKRKKVLALDLDAQGNLSQTMRADPDRPGSLAVLSRVLPAGEAVQATEQGPLIAAEPALAGADALLTQTGKEYRLKEALADLKGGYDFVLIDTPPALGILTVNALTAADSVLVPALADIYSLQGIGQLHQTIVAVRQYCNPGLRIRGILLTRHNPRSILSRDLAEVIARTARDLSTRVFHTTIREAVAVREAQAERRSLLDYAPKSTAAQDYTALVEEILRP